MSSLNSINLLHFLARIMLTGNTILPQPTERAGAPAAVSSLFDDEGGMFRVVQLLTNLVSLAWRKIGTRASVGIAMIEGPAKWGPHLSQELHVRSWESMASRLGQLVVGPPALQRRTSVLPLAGLGLAGS